jgi:hypothetical protein
MPYKFNDYQSTYVDPQSVAISKELRNRFMTNFQNADALDESLDAMKAANFANDERMKAELDANIGNKLSSFADRGDFENQAFRIHGAAKEYKEKYAPIYDNYQRYVNYQTDLADRYKKGEISSLAYNYAIPYSKYAQGYEGIKVDPKTGLVDPNSYYSPMNIMSDPKIDEKLSKALAMIEEDSRSSTTTMGLVGQTDSRTGEQGKLKITETTGGSWAGKSAEKVAKAYNAVMADPEVQAYLAQQSKLKAYSAVAGADGRVDENRLQSINASGIAAHEKEIAKLEDLIASGDVPSSKKADYKVTLDTYRASLENLKNQTGDGRLDYAASLAKQELLAPYASLAEVKISNKTTSTYNYDEAYDDLYKKRLDDETSRQKAIAEANAAAMALINKSPGEPLNLTGYSVEEIDNKKGALNVEIEKAKAVLTNGLSGIKEKEAALQTLSSATLDLKSLSEAQAGMLDEVALKNVNELKESNPEFADYDNWGAGTAGIDFKTVWNDYTSWKGSGATERDFMELMKEADYEGTNLNSFHRFMEQKHPGEQIWNVLDQTKNTYWNKNAVTKKNVKPLTFQTTESNMPVGTEPAIAAATKKNMDDMFMNKPLTALKGFQGLYRPGTDWRELGVTQKGDVGKMMEDWGEDFTDAAKIVNITYNNLDAMSLTNESAYGQFATFTVQGENNQIRKIHVPVEQVWSQDMLNAINQPMSQITRTINNVSKMSSKNEFDLAFERPLTQNDIDAEKLSKELKETKVAGPTEFQKYISENAASIQKLQISGHLDADGEYTGSPSKLKMSFSDIKTPNPQVELFKLDPNTGAYVPITIKNPETGREEKNGKFSATSDYFKAIMDNKDNGYFQIGGYNPIIE